MVHHHDADPEMRTCDRRNVADDVEIELVVEGRIPRIGRSKLKQRVAVRGRANHCLGGKIAARARSVLDDELLTKALRQPLAEKASE
jgi:hypothetical protein